MIKDIHFNYSNGTILYYEKYVYDNSGLCLGRVKLDADDKVIEFILDNYVHEYSDLSAQTVNLIDFDSVCYGEKTYQNGYIVN